MVTMMQPAGEQDLSPVAARHRGCLFDGRSTHGQAVSAWIDRAELVIEVPAGAPVPAESQHPAEGGATPGEGIAGPSPQPPEPRRMRHPLRALALGERWRSGPYPVGLPDGGTLWIDDGDPTWAGVVDALLQASGKRHVTRHLWQSWPAVMVCLALLVAVVVWVDRQGAGLAARAVLPLVPLEIDEAVGRQALKILDADYFAPSSRAADIHGLQRRFHDMARACGQGRTYVLEVRRLRDDPGLNAFALPDGTLVVLDGMLDILSEDEALALLGHEIGHVVHRHSMRHFLTSIGLLAVAGVVFSDISSVLATQVGGIQWLRYSRAAEREADAHARECLARAGIAPQAMVGLWAKFRAEIDRRGETAPPAWLRSHPDFEERLRAAQQP